jgi:dethiobiotin synthetase
LSALLIASTDSDTGKTVLTSALAAYWQTHCAGRSLGIMKPVQSGIGDRELYMRLFALNQSLTETNPIYFDLPLAPPIAADKEGRRINLETAWQAFETLSQKKDLVLVEALGSLGSPVTYESTVADLAWDWQIPLVLVVPVKLGAIGQAVANIALARQARVHIKGIVLNCVVPCTKQDVKDWAPANLIQSLTQVPVLGLIPHLPDPTNLADLTKVASNLELEQLMPISF